MFKVDSGESTSQASTGRSNAFSLMMASSARASQVGQLPAKKGAGVEKDKLRGDWLLSNALIELLGRKGLRFTGGMARTSGKQFLDVLTGVPFCFLVSERLDSDGEA